MGSCCVVRKKRFFVRRFWGSRAENGMPACIPACPLLSFIVGRTVSYARALTLVTDVSQGMAYGMGAAQDAQAVTHDSERVPQSCSRSCYGCTYTAILIKNHPRAGIATQSDPWEAEGECVTFDGTARFPASQRHRLPIALYVSPSSELSLAGTLGAAVFLQEVRNDS